jgi:DNA repair photolyase
MLFPEAAPESRLVGIAKLAASSPLLEAKRRVDYRELPTRSFISWCSGDRMPFSYTINPYRGCEFGCKYCYARYTHEFMELRKPEDFELRIFAKQWDAREFRSELVKIPVREPIAIGTATDPYQPAERRYGVTRAMLEIIARERGRSIWITTKSDLVARDVDVIARIGERNRVQVNMTVTTTDERLARLLEPYAPRPSLRLAAIRTLTSGGVPCGVLCCPLMPLINDSQANIDAVAAAAAEAGAVSFWGNVLFLKPCSKQVFLPFVEQHFPRLARRYRERFEKTAFLRGDYPDAVAKRVQAARERYGLVHRSVEYVPEAFSEGDQLSLFGESGRCVNPPGFEGSVQATPERSPPPFHG